MAVHVNPRALQPGQMVDLWRIVREIGGGTYGVVYEVEKDGKRYALKLACERERSSDPLRTDARAQREAACLLQLRHPHIIRMWAMGRWPDACSGYFYLILDFVDGYTLSEWPQRKNATPHEAAVLFDKLFEAVEYMHEHGVFHRDLSLRNIMLTKQGEPVIIDFGTADHAKASKLTEGPLPPGTPRNRSHEAQRFWEENRLKPEARYTFRATDDIFALGANLYDVLTDPTPERPKERPPLNNEALPPPSPFKVSQGRVPQALSAYVMMLLRANPEQRPQTASDARRPLREFVRYEGPEWHDTLIHPLTEQPPPELPSPQPPPAVQAPAAPVEAVPVPAAPEAVEPHRPRQRWLDPAFTGPRVLAVLVLAGAAALLYWEAPPAAVAEKPTSPRAELPSPRPTQQEASPSVKQPETSPPAPAASPSEKPPQRKLSKLERCTLLLGVGLVEWTQAGCAGVPVRPEPGDCPEEAQEAMWDELGWSAEHGGQFPITIDVNIGGHSYTTPENERTTVFKDGPVTGAMERKDDKAPEGTRLDGYLWTEVNERMIYARYYRARLPDGRTVPVCVELHSGGDTGMEKVKGSKPGHAVGYKSWDAWTVDRWGK